MENQYLEHPVEGRKSWYYRTPCKGKESVFWNTVYRTVNPENVLLLGLTVKLALQSEAEKFSVKGEVN